MDAGHFQLPSISADQINQHNPALAKNVLILWLKPNESELHLQLAEATAIDLVKLKASFS